MKLLKITKEDEVRYINPTYVRTVKGMYSEYNNEWYIVLDMINSAQSESNFIIPLDSQGEYDAKMEEILSIIGEI